MRRYNRGYSLIFFRSLNRSWLRRATRCVQHQQQRSFRDFVAEFDLEFFHHAGMAARDFHGRLVRFHGNQALLGFDGVARFDQQFDDRHVFKVANVGDFDVDECHVVLSQLIRFGKMGAEHVRCA